MIIEDGKNKEDCSLPAGIEICDPVDTTRWKRSSGSIYTIKIHNF